MSIRKGKQHGILFIIYTQDDTKEDLRRKQREPHHVISCVWTNGQKTKTLKQHHQQAKRQQKMLKG